MSTNRITDNIYKRNKSGYRGIHWDKFRNKWVAEIKIKQKRFRLGRFDTKEEAAQAYLNKRREFLNDEDCLVYTTKRREELKRYHREYYRKHRDKMNARAREQCRKLKQEVFSAYGSKCNCCGEYRIEMLTIDHINGREISLTGIDRNCGTDLYYWLRKNNYPKDNFQILCFNCNCAKGLYGICPHEKERQEYLNGPGV